MFIEVDDMRCHLDHRTGVLYFHLCYFATAFFLTPWEDGCRFATHDLDDEEEFPLIIQKQEGWKYGDSVHLSLFSEHLLRCYPEHPVSIFARSIPEEVLTGLLRCDEYQLPMLQICAATPRGAQLLHCAPDVFSFSAPAVLELSHGHPEIIHQILGIIQANCEILRHRHNASRIRG
jgi:hypothetical protein